MADAGDDGTWDAARAGWASTSRAASLSIRPWNFVSAERPHLLYSLTNSFTSVAVGLAIADGLLSLDDRVVDVLPDHVPDDVSEQGRRLTVHHPLSMTARTPHRQPCRGLATGAGRPGERLPARTVSPCRGNAAHL
ncbi:MULTISPECIES: serine hydrolase [Streptomyces]|uniref:Beta-lactamase-related domain-containing protein n=1 Tax=Streptomyces canarius TaxID=285453 RepID=A0ABQ3CXF0_9ACTN|nr:serine hydrolase [Streptomyces canarius]GHA48494.1 hypothetical protein GCM10010345_61380 [Streptomyces canarius]